MCIRDSMCPPSYALVYVPGKTWHGKREVHTLQEVSLYSSWLQGKYSIWPTALDNRMQITGSIIGEAVSRGKSRMVVIWLRTGCDFMIEWCSLIHPLLNIKLNVETCTRHLLTSARATAISFCFHSVATIPKRAGDALLSNHVVRVLSSSFQSFRFSNPCCTQ